MLNLGQISGAAAVASASAGLPLCRLPGSRGIGASTEHI